MDIRKVKKLIELLEESGIAEIEIKEGEESVRISRMTSGAVFSQPQMFAPPPLQVTSAPAAAAAAPAAPAPTSIDHMVPAPMVGTFYSAPAPGAKAFVQIGDEVKVGQVLCIIEAMKIFNEITAERAGTIKEIKVGNAEPVEFGQTLFVLTP